jgi:hypothetical protein
MTNYRRHQLSTTFGTRSAEPSGDTLFGLVHVFIDAVDASPTLRTHSTPGSPGRGPDSEF